MSFETDIKKLQKLWENSQDNNLQIDSVTIIEGLKRRQIGQTIPILPSFNQIQDFNVDWADITVPISFDIVAGNYYLLVQWEVVATLPDNWIPFARFQMGYRMSDSPISSITIDPFQQSGNTCRYNHTTQIEDIAGSVLKKVTWNISFFVSNSDSTLLNTFQTKLFFILLNPNNMV